MFRVGRVVVIEEEEEERKEERKNGRGEKGRKADRKKEKSQPKKFCLVDHPCHISSLNHNPFVGSGLKVIITFYILSRRVRSKSNEFEGTNKFVSLRDLV